MLEGCPGQMHTVAARAVMSMSISFPSSSFRGLAVTIVALGVGEAEKCRAWLTSVCGSWRRGKWASYEGAALVFLIMKAGSREPGIDAYMLY